MIQQPIEVKIYKSKGKKKGTKIQTIINMFGINIGMSTSVNPY
jgi:hypothetical protein